MLASNLRTASFEQAVTKTFDGKHPCALCKQISAGKKAEKKTEFQTALKKLEFVSARSVFIFTSPQHFTLRSESARVLISATHVPPLPPPRSMFPG